MRREQETCGIRIKIGSFWQGVSASDIYSVKECVTSQSGQIVSSTATTTQSARHRRVVQIFVHFTAVLLVLVCLWLLRLKQ